MTGLVNFAGNSLIKGVALAFLGVALAAVGTDPLTGSSRLNFGTVELLKGFDIVPVLVGLFGIGEVLSSVGSRVERIFSGKLGSWISMIPRGAELARGMMASVRGTAIGFVMGLLPGMLPALTAYLSYAVEKRISKTPEEFGKGMIEGVAAPEAANNATAMAGFIPLLTLGIPTSPSLAIILGTLLVNGLPPGPLLLQTQATFVWTIIGSMVIANTMLVILNLPLVGMWSQVSRIPYSVLGPIVLAICVVGAYAPRNTMFDVWVAIAFGVVGYAMRRFDMPLAPLVLGFLLGPLFEQSLRQALAQSNGNLLFMIDRPIAMALLFGAVIVLAATTWVRHRSRAVSGLIAASVNED